MFNDDFDGDLMEKVGLVIGFGDFDEVNGEFDDESTDLDDEDGRPLDSIYRF